LSSIDADADDRDVCCEDNGAEILAEMKAPAISTTRIVT
jgi:hypothetical protein